MQFVGGDVDKPRRRGYNSRPGVADHPMALGLPHIPIPSKQGVSVDKMRHSLGELVSGFIGGASIPDTIESFPTLRDIPPGGNPNARGLQHPNPARRNLFQEQLSQRQFINEPQMGSPSGRPYPQLPQQRHTGRTVSPPHAFQANMQNVDGMQMGRGGLLNQLSPQQVPQFRQSDGRGPAQYPLAELLRMIPQNLVPTQPELQLTASLPSQMTNQQTPQQAQHALVEQKWNNFHYSHSTASERKSNIPEPIGNNHSIHATISKDHTAGDNAESAESFAKFGQKIQWRARPTFEREETSEGPKPPLLAKWGETRASGPGPRATREEALNKRAAELR
ncbi:hypothetical protein EDB81DRAFT_810326 [Dactylonectria macrodidyma]|uniref:Uncharacterized protein n=1 Tax=Dactylonectria macrodidyma TaxID=307937 RepID=A0A9P9DX15_9HYPO|nr:hypothetical protein EDB81DRAFT_810326 [Dactylonectria macrodidyma]